MAYDQPNTGLFQSFRFMEQDARAESLLCSGLVSGFHFYQLIICFILDMETQAGVLLLKCHM